MSASNEPMDSDLLAALRGTISAGDVLTTIAEGKPNRIQDISERGVLVETERSQKAGTGPQLVPAWMLNLGWKHLQSNGSLANRHLLTEHNVRRSSAVCTLLSALPQVEVRSSRPVVIQLRGGANATGTPLRK